MRPHAACSYSEGCRWPGARTRRRPAPARPRSDGVGGRASSRRGLDRRRRAARGAGVGRAERSSLDRIRRVEWPRAGKPRLRGDGEGRRLARHRRGALRAHPGPAPPPARDHRSRRRAHVRRGDQPDRLPGAGGRRLERHAALQQHHAAQEPRQRRAPLKMAIDEGRIELGGVDRSYQSAPNFPTLWSTPFAPDLRNRWLRFLLHVRFDFDSDGFVELYGDLDGRGTVVPMPRTHTPTIKRNDDGPSPATRAWIYRHADVLHCTEPRRPRSSPTEVGRRGRGLPGRRPAIGRPRADRLRRPAPPPIARQGLRVARPQSQGHPRPAVAGRRRRSHGRARAATSRAAFAPVSSSRARPREGPHRAPRRRGVRHSRLPRGVVSARLRRGLPRDPAENAGRKSRLRTRLVLDVVDRAGNRTVRRRELTLR